jgi:hypothetical protein
LFHRHRPSGAEPPADAIEVPEAPQDARQVRVDGEWTTAPVIRQMVLKSIVQARIFEAGKMPAAFAALTANPVYFARRMDSSKPPIYAQVLST